MFSLLKHGVQHGAAVKNLEAKFRGISIKKEFTKHTSSYDSYTCLWNSLLFMNAKRQIHPKGKGKGGDCNWTHLSG